MKKSILTALLLISFTLTGCGGPSASERYNAAYKRANEIQNFIDNGEAWNKNITIVEYKKLTNEIEEKLKIMEDAVKDEPKLLSNYKFKKNTLDEFIKFCKKDIKKLETKGYSRLKG